MDTTLIQESKVFEKKSQRGGLVLVEVSPSNEKTLQTWLMTVSRGTERQMLRHIQLTLEINVPEFVWHELLEMMVAGVIPSGKLTAMGKSAKYLEIDSFRAKTQGRASIPSDMLRPSGEAHLAYEKFQESTQDLIEKLQELGVCDEQIGFLTPRTREVKGIWSLTLEEAVSVLRISSRESAIWELRELAISLREILREGIPGFNLIGNLP